MTKHWLWLFVPILACSSTSTPDAPPGGAGGAAGASSSSSSGGMGGSGGGPAVLCDERDAAFGCDDGGMGGAGGEEPLPGPADAGKCPVMNGGQGCTNDADCPPVPSACGWHFTCDPLPVPPGSACVWHELGDGGP